MLGYLERIQVRYISESTATYIPFVCGCASTCDSSTPLFIVPYLDNECLMSYLRLSDLIYDTRSTGKAAVFHRVYFFSTLPAVAFPTGLDAPTHGF